MIRLLAPFALLAALTGPAGGDDKAASPPDAPVSFHRQVLPILQRKCQGCHQPAKANGKLNLTTFEALKAGGSSGPLFEAGKPGEGSLLENVNGKPPSMPPNAPALGADEVATLARWIEQGAKDDTPPMAKDTIGRRSSAGLCRGSRHHGPGVRPDGQTLAISGYREVLIHKADGSGLVGRLVGAGAADRGVGVLARRGDPGGRGRIARPVRRGPVLGPEARQAQGGAAVDLRHPLRRRIRPRRGAVRLRLRRQLGEGRRGQGRPRGPEGRLALRLGLRHRVLEGGEAPDHPRPRRRPEVDRGGDRVVHRRHRQELRRVEGAGPEPEDDTVAIGGDEKIPRLYKIFRTQARDPSYTDFNLLRAFEAQPGPISALAFAPDGSTLAVGGSGGQARLYRVADGVKVATLPGHQGGSSPSPTPPTARRSPPAASTAPSGSSPSPTAADRGVRPRAHRGDGGGVDRERLSR